MNNHTSLAAVTRADRAITDEGWIRDMLCRAPLGVLATAVPTDDPAAPQPFISTLSFVYDSSRHAIYFHTARRGRVWENAHANPRACFTVSEMGRLLPAKTALNFGVEYASVVIFGGLVLVDEPVEAEYGLQLLMDKYFPYHRPGRDYRPITPEERAVTAVFRLDIAEWSGKQKKAPADFPGAFFWPPQP